MAQLLLLIDATASLRLASMVCPGRGPWLGPDDAESERPYGIVERRSTFAHGFVHGCSLRRQRRHFDLLLCSISSAPTSAVGCRCLFGDAAVNCTTVIVSERRLFRDGLKELLQNTRFSVIAEAADTSGVVSTIERGAVPALIICHISSDQNPEAAHDMVRGLRQYFAEAKFVAITETCNEPHLSNCLSADVDAILFTNISSEILVRSLELVLCDVSLFSAEILSLIADDAFGLCRDPAPHRAKPGLPDETVFEQRLNVALSAREQQIMGCLARGLSNKQIARELDIAEATVKVYVKSLLRKTGVDNRTQAAIWALRESPPRAA
jgi:two-component system nitrate/nitrite response regulator NarL